MNNNEKIRDIIVARRKELGISLSEMARRLNIPKSTLSRYENLKHQYPLDEIQNFSSVLDLDPKYILGLNQISSIDELYNQLEPERQKIVYDTAKEQLAQQNKSSNNVVNINKKKYDTLAAHSPDPNKVFTDEEKLKINKFLDKVDADYDRKQKECKHLFDDESDDKE